MSRLHGYSRPLLFVALLAAGCGGGPKLVPVEGKVTFNGQPLVPGSVWLIPQDGKGDKASGLIQLDGSFKLRTYPHGDGVVAGTYKVYLSLGGGTPPGLEACTDPEKTPLKVDVPAAGLKDWKLALPQ